MIKAHLHVVNLSQLIKRIFSIFVNLMFSKRAFSIMNFIHNKHRNRLIVERFNMLQFIFMNDVVLHKNKNQSLRNMLSLNSDDEIKLENLNKFHEIVTLSKHSREKNEKNENIEKKMFNIQSTINDFVS